MIVNITALDTAPESLPWWRAMNDLTVGQDQTLTGLEANNATDYKQLNASLNGVLNRYSDVSTLINKIPFTETQCTQINGFGAPSTAFVTIVTHTFTVPAGKTTASVFGEFDCTPGVTPSTFADFDAYALAQGFTTFADFDAVWSGQTFADFDAIWSSAVDPYMYMQVVVNGPDVAVGSALPTVPTGGVASGNVALTATVPNQASLETPFPTETNYLEAGETITVRYRIAAVSSSIPASVLNIANCNSVVTWS